MPKINFHILSIFPKMVENYTLESILQKAKEKGILDFHFYNLRDYSRDKHKKLDDKPYAGGPGMLMYAQPILDCVEQIKQKVNSKKLKIILFKPKGKILTTKMAKTFAKKYEHILLICGRYEGIDSRVEKILKPEIVSIGEYILTGGEIPAMAFIDTVSRQVKGVLGDIDSLEERRGYRDEFYTRPEVLEWKGKKYKVPKVLLSGDHKKIEEWKKGTK